MTRLQALESFCQYPPDRDGNVIAAIAYELEQIGDFFLSPDARRWLERRRAYKREAPCAR